MNLLCLEGCRPELGCTVVLSGPDASELKKVRHALKKCIALARSLFYESEYLKFLRPKLVGIDKDAEEVNIMDFGSKSHNSRFSLNDDTNLVQAPFLFDKMMERQSLIFEHFSLALPHKK